MTMRAWLQASLIVLTVLQAGAGAWQLLAPRSFYDDFPLPGHPWVAMLPPFNEHLMRDVGSLNLAMAVVLGVAAVSMERRFVLVALTAELVFALPHMLFHITHLEHFPPVDAIAQTTVLAVTTAVLIALLVLAAQLGNIAPSERPIELSALSPSRNTSGNCGGRPGPLC